MPYCRRGPPSVTLHMVVARPHRDGERDANLHARSARRAPRSGAGGVGWHHRRWTRDRSGSALLLCRSVGILRSPGPVPPGRPLPSGPSREAFLGALVDSLGRACQAAHRVRRGTRSDRAPLIEW